MKRRILACLLMLCMVLTLVPLLCFAATAKDDGIVATVTLDGRTLAEATNLADAFAAAAKREGSTVKLEADVVITAGFDFNGTYTFDLNGHTITAHAPLIQTKGTVTIVDESAEKTGAIRGLGAPALELRGTAVNKEDAEGNSQTYYDGNVILKSGTFGATDCDFAIYNKGQGILYLTGTPKLEKGIYLAFADSLCGTDKPAEGAERGENPYAGEVISVYYGEDPIPENALLLKDGDTEKFEFAQRGFFTPQSVENTYIYSKWGYLSAIIVIAVGVIVLILALCLFGSFRKTMKKIRKLNVLAIPAFLPFMAGMGDTWRLVLILMAAFLLISIILFIVMQILLKKKLKKAVKAHEERKKAEAEAAPAEEAPVEEAPAEEAPAEEAPAEEAPAEEAPAEEAPAEEAPAEEAPAEEAPAEEAPAEEAPAEEAPAEEAPAEEAPAEEAPAEEAPAEEAPAEEAPAEEAPAEEAPAEEAPAEEAPAEEAPAEEAPAEEAPAEEAPAEEADEEEAEEEEAEDADEDDDESKADRQPNVLVSVPVIGADGKATSYTTYKKSFLARIVLSSEEVQERYNVMKNALLSYKKVNARISWSYESVKSARTQLAKFAIRGKTLCMYLALDPRTLGDSKYNVSDESESKKYDTVPCCLRLTSKRSIKWGLELIEKMATELGLEFNPKYKQTNYIPDAKTDEELLELGLIKKVQ